MENIKLETTGQKHISNLATDIKKLIAEDNSALVNPLVCYTLNRMPNGDDKAPHLVRN